LITGIQSRELRHALSIADDLSTEQKIFDAAFRKAKESRDERVATQEQVLSVGRDLVALAAQDFREARNQFNERMQREGLTGEFRASVYEPRDEKQSNWFFASVVTCAETLGYFADSLESRTSKNTVTPTSFCPLTLLVVLSKASSPSPPSSSKSSAAKAVARYVGRL
jgi:hypothetical protein